jgi:hypothetical protein
MSEFSPGPAPQDLQFERAEPLTEASAGPDARRCVVCKLPIADSYFHAQGQVVCPNCAGRIQSGQQAPPAIALGRAALYGLGAAAAGCALYAAVAILLHLEIGIIAIAVGIMVGKAIRAGSNGLGGRPQQILHQGKAGQSDAPRAVDSATPKSRMSPVGAIVTLLLIFAAAPFLNLTSGIGGLISLFIIFIGLRQAWKLTGRNEILLMGPYPASQAQ